MKYLVLIIISISFAGNIQADSEIYKNKEVKEFINFMYAEHQYNKKELESLFNSIKPESRLKKYFKKAPERTLTWNGCKKYELNCTNYKNLFVTKKHVKNGLKFWAENELILSQAYKKYGVPPEIIIAIVGIESKFGKRTGTFKTFDTLASLSLGPNKGRRAKFYRKELINFLLMCKENNFNPQDVKGSYAGALGQPQFISSSYRYYAVDFNNDKKVDLWNSNADIIGSVANYFKKNGWKNNQPIMSNINSHDSMQEIIEEQSRKTYKPKTPYVEFSRRNILSSEPVSNQTLLAIIARKEPGKTVYNFGHENFYAITRYNRSRLYALAVYFLSEEIKNSKSKASKL